MFSEIALEQSCVKLAKEAKCLLLKIQGTRGYPDRLLIPNKGPLVLVELKDPLGKLSPMQEVIFATLEAMGHRVFVIRSVEEFRALLRLVTFK